MRSAMNSWIIPFWGNSEISASEARVESAAEVAKREEATAEGCRTTEQVDQALNRSTGSPTENYSSPTPEAGATITG